MADLKKEISESYSLVTDEGIALHGLFIIDKEGIIEHCTINNESFGRSVDETLRVLEAVQYVQIRPLSLQLDSALVSKCGCPPPPSPFCCAPCFLLRFTGSR